MSQIGWVSIHRKIMDNESLWNDKPFNRGAAWIDILLNANHEDKKMLFDANMITIQRGQWLTSIRKLSERWGWSKCKVVKFLEVLETEQMLIKNSNAKRTLLTIVNYDVYQNQEDSERTVKGHSKDTERTLNGTNNKDNNDNNDNKENKRKKDIKKEAQTYFENEEVNKAYLSYLDFRRTVKKKPLKTDRGIQANINELNKLSHGDDALAIRIINQSIDHEWLGFFEIKSNTPKQQREETSTNEPRSNVRDLEYYKQRFGFDYSTIGEDEPLPFV